MTSKKIPVILDTDIGGDIDDIWALAFLLRCPELELRLVTEVLCEGNYETKIIAKLLKIVGRTDIPIGLGVPGKSGT